MSDVVELHFIVGSRGVDEEPVTPEIATPLQLALLEIMAVCNRHGVSIEARGKEDLFLETGGPKTAYIFHENEKAIRFAYGYLP